MKVNWKGLKFKSWLYLMAFSVIILGVLWALQFLLMNAFYVNMKTNEVISIGERVVADYGQGDFTKLVHEYAFRNNVRIALYDESGKLAEGADGFGVPTIPDGGGISRGGDFGIAPQQLFERIQQAFAESKADSVHFADAEGRKNMSQIVYAAKVVDAQGAQKYLCVICPVPPIDSTTSVLRTQFFIIAGILLVLALVMAQIIARKMSRPIVQLTRSAEQLARGDLTAHFEGEGYTEIYQLASTLNYATGELSKLDNYRREFVANVSHDLKTPLTIIKMYGEMLRDVSGDNPTKRAEHSQRIITEADWLTGMVSEILELSKLESGNAVLRREDVNLSRCTQDTLASFQVLCERDGYCFETDVEPEVVVKGDPAYLKRVVYNLVSNAVNYTGEDKKVFISLHNKDGQARVAVRDTGAGIPAEERDSIWERYYKSGKAHKRAVVGTGLGLSIVRQALQLHGARYGVDSVAGQGSTFWFELPTE